jgi:ABC-type protease/lipase transport system fused ATPase/permease subunit
MTLLVLDRVSKCHRIGPREHVVLRDVSLELDTGELAVVWGLRRSGRSTLLRIAAGVEDTDAGSVRFEGRDLADRGRAVMGAGIGYCRKRFAPTDGPAVFGWPRTIWTAPRPSGSHSPVRSC